jgi:hypothetical protein
VLSSLLAAISARSERSYVNLVSLVAVTWLLLLPFFPRRIGGAGGGSEKAIVGVIGLCPQAILSCLRASWHEA